MNQDIGTCSLGESLASVALRVRACGRGSGRANEQR